ncbi:MAG TPA: reverse transcriptase domain-containing protein [Planctomycetaceae bacterium]|nr:reverse transcriptase domain-containing protein [Planctomycetaceae bacterium]
MSFDTPPRRWHGTTVDTQTDDGRPTRRHVGNAQAFLRRHERDCEQYDRLTTAGQRKLRGELVDRIADTRNLWHAAWQLTRDGEKAPGPNGERLHRLLRDNPRRVWAELRRLSGAIQSRTYEAGPTRVKHILKSSGRGTRPLEIANWQDQVVHRAIVQIIQPLLDPDLDIASAGFRPGIDRLDTLARAVTLAERQGRHVWVTADLRDAFTCVPHTALLDRLQTVLDCEPITRLIRRAVVGNNNRQPGLPQGSPQSPLLLNVLLDGALDKRWHHRHPDRPHSRYADDILILCRNAEEARESHAELRQLVQPVGFQLKGTTETDIRDLAVGDAAEWLGVAIRLKGGQFVFELPQRFSERLRHHLELGLAESDGVLCCGAILRGVMEQLGPIFEHVPQSEVFRHLADATRLLEIDEIPDQRDLLDAWQNGATRFQTLRQLWRQLIAFDETSSTTWGEGSAARHPTRSTILAASAPSILFTTSVARTRAKDGWAYAIVKPGAATTEDRLSIPSRL